MSHPESENPTESQPSDRSPDPTTGSKNQPGPVPRPQNPSIRRNATAQMLGRLVYLATRVALPPITLHFVSLEEYGIWSTCFLIIGYIGMGAFGVANVYIRFAAQYNATGQQQEIGKLLAVGLTITLGFSALVLILLYLGMPWIVEWFKIPNHLQATATTLILGSVATMLLDMTFGAFAYVLQGLQRIVQQTLVWIVSFLLETVVMIGLLMEGFGVKGLLLAFAARYIFSTLAYMVLCYRAVPGLRLQLRGAGKETYRLFFGYGGILQLSGLLSIFLYSCERLAAGMLAGVGSVGLLDIGQKFPMMSSQLFGSAQNSFLTTLTHLHAQNRLDEMVEVYAKGTRYLNLLNGTAMGFMAPFGFYLITAWMGPSKPYPEAATIMALAAIGYHLHAITGPATTYFQGTHKPWRPLLGLLIPQLLIAGCALIWLLRLQEDGLLAVVAAMAIARVSSSLIFLAQTNRAINYGQLRFLWSVLLPGLMPYGIGYGLWHLTQNWMSGISLERLDLLPVLAGLGMGYIVVTGLIFLAVFANRQERSSILRRFKRA